LTEVAGCQQQDQPSRFQPNRTCCKSTGFRAPQPLFVCSTTSRAHQSLGRIPRPKAQAARLYHSAPPQGPQRHTGPPPLAADGLLLRLAGPGPGPGRGVPAAETHPLQQALPRSSLFQGRSRGCPASFPASTNRARRAAFPLF
jgi:hypothetical protein